MYKIPWSTRLWLKFRKILVKLKILKPLQWYWYEFPGEVYVNPKAVKVIKDLEKK